MHLSPGGGRRVLGALVALLIIAADLSPFGKHLLRLPSAVTVAVGQRQTIVLDAPGRIGVRASGAGTRLELDGAPAPATWRTVSGTALRLLPADPGRYTLRLRLLGVLPWRSLRVDAVAVPDLVPGGQAVGVVLHSRGPLVVAMRSVPGPGGQVPSPAAAAGIRPGDVLLRIDNRAVTTPQEVAAALAGVPDGGTASVTVLRAGRTLRLRVRPVRAAAAAPPLIGAWVREDTGGIGTLTFTAAQGVFGALGHPVVDPTTDTPIVLGTGALLPSLISGMERSRDGRPGEKIGVLIGGSPGLGTVLANTAFGVFGRLDRTPGAGPLTEPLPVALPDQVHTGPAQILTVIGGRTVGSFAARISAILPQRRPTTRGFVVTITDHRLLAATGGIVQGMSGSPVIQDGRLIGAVTHVFVDNPARGYGVLAVWMAETAGLLPAASGSSGI